MSRAPSDLAPRFARRRCSRERTRRGFTILEVLVAAGITAILAGFMVATLSNVTGFWSRTSGKLSAEAQGRLILDQVALDLQSALYRDDGNTWLAATIPANTNNTISLWDNTGVVGNAVKPANNAGSLQGIAAGSFAEARFGVAGTWLRFFTVKRGSNPAASNATTTATSTSAPVAVAYQIVRRRTTANTVNTDRRYLLHRAEVRPAALSAPQSGTLQSGFDIVAAAYQPTGVSTQVGAPAEIRFPTINSVLAENVIDFGVRLYVYEPNTATGGLDLRQIFPETASDLTHTATLPPRIRNSDSKFVNCFPEVVDVMVRVLTDDGARTLAQFEAGRITAPPGTSQQQYWWELARANSQVFTRRVILNARPL